MTTLKRHLGRIKNTDRRCLVVYMQLPGDPKHALIVDTDALHPRIHDELMEVVESLEGQSEVTLGNLLGRRVLAATGVDMLSSLHSYGLLQRVPVSNVTMYPAPNYPMALEEVIKLSTNNLAPQNSPLAAPVLKEEVAPLAPQPEPGAPVEALLPEVDHSRFNRVVENQNIDRQEEQYDMAKGLLIEAQMLADDAARKREQAYRIAPSLRPAVAPNNAVAVAAQTPAAGPTVEQQSAALAAVADALHEAAIESVVPTKRGPGRPRKNAS